MNELNLNNHKNVTQEGKTTMSLNEKEKLILETIRENPFIAQQELANLIGLSRSATANLISGLVKKDYLLGKAYVLNDEEPIICIGGANIDRRYLVKDALVQGTSNNVQSRTNVGGVARNVAENLGRLEEKVMLFSVAGNDAEWKMIESHSEHFMNIKAVDSIEGCPTGTFMEVIGVDGKMVLGLAEVDIFDKMTPDWINKHLSVLKRSKYIIIDLNCPKETIEFLISFAVKYEVPIALLTVSVQRLSNLPSYLEGINVLITKCSETEAHFNMIIKTDDDLKEAVEKWLNNGKGPEHVFVSKGSTKIAYGSQKDGVHIFNYSSEQNDHYNWGMNEAFCAGLVFNRLQDKSITESIMIGLTNAYHTSQSLYVVRPNLSKSQLKNEYNGCLIDKVFYE
ncbi:putative transcriptional regulator with a sugar kinase domain, GntR family [Carnobacterium sp. 17-4]|nr:putative transcriptional regulator with a sugar kinase domain, GntR family [Carnobacterium sp. 17-4]